MGELLRLGVFEEEPGGAAPQRSHDVFVGVEGREHGDGGRLGEVTEKPQQGQSVHVGHANVQQDNIRVRGRHDVERIFPRRGSHDAKVIGGVEDHREPRADERFVVHDHHVDHVLSLSYPPER